MSPFSQIEPKKSNEMMQVKCIFSLIASHFKTFNIYLEKEKVWLCTVSFLKIIIDGPDHLVGIYFVIMVTQNQIVLRTV